jgi:hypothetical protein
LPSTELPSQTRQRLADLRASGRFDALTPLWRHRTDPYTSKAWVLPDGRAVSLHCWHYEWILANQPTAEAFGMSFGGLPRAEAPVRIAAVKAGFFRVNYELRDGHLTIEGLESRLTPRIRDALELILLENLDQVGTLTIHRFDDMVTTLRHRVEVALGQLPSTNDRLQVVARLLTPPGP